MLQHCKNLTTFYWHFIKQTPWKFALLFFMPLVWCSAETYVPYLVKNLLDEMTLKPNEVSSFLIDAVLAYVFLVAAIEISLRISNYLCIKILPNLKEKIREDALHCVQKKSLAFFQIHQSGSLLNSLKHIVDSFEQLLLCLLYGIYPLIVTFLVTAILIFSISKLFAAIFAGWFLGMNIITFFFLQPALETADKYAFSESRLLGFVGDLFKNIILIKTFPSNALDQTLLDELQHKNAKQSTEAEWVSFRADSLRGIISFLLLAFMFIFLVKGWQKNLISLGDFAFITTICFYVRRTTWIAATYLLTFFKQVGIARQSFNALISFPGLTKLLSKTPIENFKRDICFQSIKFVHGKNKIIYNDFNLFIPDKQKIGIMGSSGAGKTTLIHLLLGLFEPDNGKILFGNCPIEELDPEILKTQISYVPQTAPLFHRSIFENIQYGNPNATYDEVINASKACLCHSFVSHFASGYQTIVGEDGMKLSGGQRQRLALARAYLKNSPILILDEATSAMDFFTERKVLDVFLPQDKTILIISHRASALNKLERLLVLEEGTLMQDGKPEEILAVFRNGGPKGDIEKVLLPKGSSDEN